MQDRFKYRYLYENKLYDVEMIDFRTLHVYFKEKDNKVCTRTKLNFKNLIQSTGLTDKNGKLIYEGDILKDDTDILASVVWEDEEAKFIIEEKNRYVVDISSDICDEIEVIGNIYENSELLEVPQCQK